PRGLSRISGMYRAACAVLIAASCLAGADLRLLEAVKKRDPDSVAALLREHAPVNAAQPDGATALAWAVHLDDARTAELLLGAGAKADTADEYGDTPLTLACANGN